MQAHRLSCLERIMDTQDLHTLPDAMQRNRHGACHAIMRIRRVANCPNEAFTRRAQQNRAAKSMKNRYMKILFLSVILFFIGINLLKLHGVNIYNAIGKGNLNR